MNKERQNTGTHKPEGFKDTPIGKLPADWEVARLDEIAVPLTETAGQNKYETVSISAGVGFVNQAEKFGKELSGKQYEKYTVLHKGDFSYNKGNSNRYPQGCIYRLNDRESAAVPNVFESFRIVKGCPEYYEQLFISGFLNHQLYKKINHGVRDDGLLNLTSKDFYNCIVPFPPIHQQKKIVEILSICDKLIQQYRKKTKYYIDLKKACLNKIFPKEDCSIPEVRFPGFSGMWEQRKVGEVSKRVIVGLATSVTQYYRTEGIPMLRNLNIKDNYLDDTDILFLERSYAESQVSKKIHTGDVLTVHTGYIGTSCVVPEKYDKCLTFTTLITTTDTSILQGEFLAQYLNSEIGMSAVQAVTTQGGRQNLNTYDFVKVEIQYPSLAEQNAICKMLRSIDDLITFHQRESKLLQKKKEALMISLLTGIMRSNI